MKKLKNCSSVLRFLLGSCFYALPAGDNRSGTMDNKRLLRSRGR